MSKRVSHDKVNAGASSSYRSSAKVQLSIYGEKMGNRGLIEDVCSLRRLSMIKRQ